MSDCCEAKDFDGTSMGYRRALVAVILINAVMFGVEVWAGITSHSQALLADSLDFAADALTYTLSLAVIGMSIRTRAKASLFKAGTLILVAVTVLGTTLARFFGGAIPVAETMGVIGGVALGANLLSVLILLKWRDGDSNVRSVWLCSRNDSISNVGVIAAGGFVALTGSAYPDLVLALLMAGLFLHSAAQIFSQARAEMRGEVPTTSVHDHHGHAH